MAAHSPSLRIAAAVAGGVARRGDPERLALARRDLAAERLACYIGRVLADAPPLTIEQRDRLACLLRGDAA